MKSFTMVLLASAALTLPALAEQRYQGHVSRDEYQQQDRSDRDQARGEEQTGPMRIEAEDLSSSEISKIQHALRDAGYHVGGVDGEWGPNTRQALKDFQEDQGMAATGRLNRRVISALGLDPQRFAAKDYNRDDAYRAGGDREFSSGSERGRRYGYGGSDRDRDDYTSRRDERD